MTHLSVYHFHCMFKVWKKTAADLKQLMMTITFADSESTAFEDMDVWVSEECSKEDATHTLPAGTYLATRIGITSTLGYFSAWEALGNYVMYSREEFDNTVSMLEFTHNPIALFSAVDMTLSARLLTKDK